MMGAVILYAAENPHMHAQRLSPRENFSRTTTKFKDAIAPKTRSPEVMRAARTTSSHKPELGLKSIKMVLTC